MTRRQIEKQRERVQKLLQLIEENPDLRILPMVNTDIVCDDCYAYWSGNWGEAEIDEVYMPSGKDRIYFRSTDEEELIDEVYDVLETNNEENLSDDELYEKAKKKVEGYGWEKVIVVRIDP